MPETCIDPLTDHQTTCFNCSKTETGKTKLFKCSRCHAISYCGRECQVADRPRHKWNCVPVMVTEYEGKGRGLVASRDFKVGELPIQMQSRCLRLNAVCRTLKLSTL